MLRSHPWNCAIRRVLLSPDVTPPAFGYAHRFQRPADWLRTVAVGERDWDGVEYRTESGFYLCDDAAFHLCYVFDNDVPETYDSMLVAAMETAMAAALAYPVTKSTSLADALAMELRATLSVGRGLDSQDDPPETLGDQPLLRSRFGGRVR